MSAGETITLSASLTGEVLGESWTVVVPDTPSWSTLQ
jgi:hypothetical protein